MSARRPNHRLVKIHFSYTVGEVALLLNVHKNTVRQWLSQGLRPIDAQRPLLIAGETLVVFLKARRAQNKRPCRPGEIYCLRCRLPRTPAEGQAMYLPLTVERGNIIGICSSCGARLFRRVALANLALAAGSLVITVGTANNT